MASWDTMDTMDVRLPAASKGICSKAWASSWLVPTYNLSARRGRKLSSGTMRYRERTISTNLPGVDSRRQNYILHCGRFVDYVYSAFVILVPRVAGKAENCNDSMIV